MFCSWRLLYELAVLISNFILRLVHVGTVLVGVSGDEPSKKLRSVATEAMLSVIGVDLTSLVFRGKFVFVAQVGSPQKTVFELRDTSPPYGLPMDILITGRSMKTGESIQDARNFKLSQCLDSPWTQIVFCLLSLLLRCLEVPEKHRYTIFFFSVSDQVIFNFPISFSSVLFHVFFVCCLSR